MFFDSVLYFFVGVLGVQCAFDRIEGELCQTKKAVGKCVHVYRCLSSVLDLKNRNNPSICSFRNREPVICCLDCELVNDTRNAVVDSEGGIFFKNGQKARDTERRPLLDIGFPQDGGFAIIATLVRGGLAIAVYVVAFYRERCCPFSKCIEYRTYLPYPCKTNGVERVWDHQRQCHLFETTFKTVVVGGHDAERSRYPHMALLGYGSNQDSAQWLCGGSLISDQFVLTAAHCISETVIGPVRFVAMGILKRSDPDKLWHIYNVRRTIAHPEYRPPSKYHDIALLETAKLVVFSKDVFPACLDFHGGDRYVAFATGWGKLGKNRPLADNLQEVSLLKFSTEDCLKHFPPHRLLKEGYNANMQMCYGDENQPKDTCEGDSGGPLQVTSEFSKCLHTVIGVTSFGRACGYAGDAGMYTRVSHYVPWIESIVWPGH